MCGIAGIINFASLEAAVGIAAGFRQVMARRGPDGDGTWHDDRVLFTHRRLAVIDLAGAIQPLFNEDRSLAAVVNGEIYNYRALRDELRARGHIFSTDGDCEVIVHGYEEFGDGVWARLDGMFAAALYDIRRGMLYLARDIFGKKPLVYFQNGRELVFASSLNALKCHPAFPARQFRPEAVRDFLSYWYVPGPETVFPGVWKVPPAHVVACDIADGSLRIQRYFSLDYRNKLTSDPREWAEETQRLLTLAVRKRLMADVPLGTFLSGGMDSLLITGLVLESGASNPDIYTMGFEQAAYDEREAARDTLAHFRRLGLDNFTAHEKVARADDFGFLRLLLHDVGEPYADASIMPTGLMCRFAREKLVVALSGDGADEVFGGYERYMAMRFYRKLDWLPPALRRLMFGTLSALLPHAGERSTAGKYKRLFDLARFRELERYYRLMDKAGADGKNRIFGPRLRDLAAPEDAAGEYLLGVLRHTTTSDPAERFAEADITSYLANDILPKVDTASMAAALEVRCPFLDRDLAVWAAGLPFAAKLNGNSRKDILKRAFPALLPPELASRRKKGFGVPVAQYLSCQWRPELERTLTNGALVEEGWLDPEGARLLLRRHDQAAVNLQWGLLCLGVFLEHELV